MIFQIWAMSALCAGVFAAPTLTYAAGSGEKPAGVEILSDYFQMLAKKVQAGKDMAVAPVCDLRNAVLPVACKHSLFAVRETVRTDYTQLLRPCQP